MELAHPLLLLIAGVLAAVAILELRLAYVPSAPVHVSNPLAGSRFASTALGLSGLSVGGAAGVGHSDVALHAAAAISLLLVAGFDMFERRVIHTVGAIGTFTTSTALAAVGWVRSAAPGLGLTIATAGVILAMVLMTGAIVVNGGLRRPIVDVLCDLSDTTAARRVRRLEWLLVAALVAWLLVASTDALARLAS